MRLNYTIFLYNFPAFLSFFGEGTFFYSYLSVYLKLVSKEISNFASEFDTWGITEHRPWGRIR